MRKRQIEQEREMEVPEGMKEEGERGMEYLDELFTFAVVLRGHVRDLEEIKEYVISEYVNKGRVKMIKPTYEKKEIYLMTDEQWREYQQLKKRDERLVGGGFP